MELVAVSTDLLLEQLKSCDHEEFQEEIKENEVYASRCFVLPLKEFGPYLGENQDILSELLYEISIQFLSDHRKMLTPQLGGTMTVYDKMVNPATVKQIAGAFDKSRFKPYEGHFKTDAQITIYVALKKSFTGQALCHRSILNPAADGKPSNRGVFLARTVIS